MALGDGGENDPFGEMHMQVHGEMDWEMYL